MKFRSIFSKLPLAHTELRSSWKQIVLSAYVLALQANYRDDIRQLSLAKPVRESYIS